MNERFRRFRAPDYGRRLTPVVALVAMLLAVAWPATAPAEPPTSVSVAQWADEVWTHALGRDADRALELLRQLPDEHDNLGVRRLHERITQWETHQKAVETSRLETLAEARAEFETAIEEDDQREALRAVIEMFDLMPDKQERIAKRSTPEIKQLILTALEEARKAEAEGRILEARDWFARLHLLHEDERTYYEDVKRVGERIALLGYYAPERLHELSNDFTVANGDDPLPAYNDSGPTWEDKVDRVSWRMLDDALKYAESKHIDPHHYGELAVGGLEAIRTLITTADLSREFPGLASDEDRKALLAFVNASLDKAKSVDEMRYSDYYRIMRDLMRENRVTVAIPDEVMYREFGNGALAVLDEFSGVIWPHEKAMFDRTLTSEFVGIGVQIQLDAGRNLMVAAPLDGTPAQRAGIRRGDLIRMIDGRSTVGITLQQAVEQITGDRGSKVVLTIDREGTEDALDITIKRDVIPLYSVKGWRRNGPSETDWDFFIDPDNNIGYIRLTSFSDDTVAEFDRAIMSMQEQRGLSGLILDLRFNPGGLLSAATEICNRFVAKGRLVSTEDRIRPREVAFASAAKASLRGLPTVVLINNGSASASEIVSGCLQDHEAAVIVGERSYGKGTVQQVIPLEYSKAYLKLTMQQYRLPEGRLIHRQPNATEWGIDPDISVAMSADQIVDVLLLRQEADLLVFEDGEPIIPEDFQDTDEEGNPVALPDPARLLGEGIDPQLETALLLLRSRRLAELAGHAMLDI